MMKQWILLMSVIAVMIIDQQGVSAQTLPCPATGDAQEADCLLSQGTNAIEKERNLEKGQKLLTQALSIREKETPAPDSLEQAHQYLALADIYHALGRNGKAEPMYRHSLTILRNLVGYDDLENVVVIDHLALVLMDMGRFVEAEPGLKHSLDILEKTKGPDDPALIAPLDKLSWICDAQHRGTEAAAYRKRAQAIRAKNP